MAGLEKFEMPAEESDSDFVTNRHFDREIVILREFAKSRLDATDRLIQEQNKFLEMRFDNLTKNDAAMGSQIIAQQNKISELTGRLDRAEGGTARHSASVALAVSISAVIMSIIVGSLSIVRYNTSPPTIIKEKPSSYDGT